MATSSTTTCFLSCSSTANLQSWVGPILQLLSDSGWVRTSDTGQTDLADMPAAAAANTVCGYQIWRMNDSLQSTVPVFVKFEFGSGGAVGNYSIWVTVGTGSDGAGNITWIIQPQTRACYSATGSVTAASNFLGSGGNNRLVFFARSFVLANSYYLRLNFSIERTHAANGSDTSSGVMILANGGGSASAVFGPMGLFRVATFSGSQPPTSTSIGAYVPSGTTWAYDGNYVGVCPVSFFIDGPTNPSKNLMVYLDPDMSRLVPVSIPCYGTNLNFMPIGSALLSTVASGNANSSLLIRWD